MADRGIEPTPVELLSRLDSLEPEVPPGFAEELLAHLERRRRDRPGGVRPLAAPVVATTPPRQPRASGTRRGAAIAAAVAVAVAVVGGVLATLRPAPTPEAPPITVPPAESTPVTTAAFVTTTSAAPSTTVAAPPTTAAPEPIQVRVEIPGWTRHDHGPIEGVLASAGGAGELAAWGAGGFAIYDVDRDTWREVAAPPVAADSAAQLHAIGGGYVAMSVDGTAAWFDPATDTWSAPVAAPETIDRVFDAVVADDVLFVVGHPVAGRPLGLLTAARFDPGELRWSTLPDPPITLTEGHLAWSGSGVVVFGGDLDHFRAPRHPSGSAHGAVFDPQTETWTELSISGLSPNAVSIVGHAGTVMAWDYLDHAKTLSVDREWIDLASSGIDTGEDFTTLVSAGMRIVGTHFGQVVVYEPERDEWTNVVTPGSASLGRVGEPLVRPVAVGGDVYFWSHRRDGTELWRLDPAAAVSLQPTVTASGWDVLAPSIMDHRPRAAVTWTPEGLVVWGGEVPDGSERPQEAGWPATDQGAVYDPAGHRWEELPRSPLRARTDAVAVWTGSELLLIGGGAGNAAYSPRTGWRDVPTHAVPATTDAAVVWTGTELIVWGGAAGRGAAYQPAADGWRDLPEAPISGRTDHSAVWTGSEMLIWGGWVEADEAQRAQGYEIVAGQDGAAYDPETDSWRALPSIPAELELSHQTAVWTGSEMVVFGANLERFGRSGELADEPLLAGAAYDPASDSWRVIADLPFTTEQPHEGFGRHTSAWTGTRMVVWAPPSLTGDGPRLWVYDPAADRWAEGPSAPYPADSPVLIVGGDHLYAHGGPPHWGLERTLRIPLDLLP